jgi:transcriptional regulator GlxA family with amidase domain
MAGLLVLDRPILAWQRLAEMPNNPRIPPRLGVGLDAGARPDAGAKPDASARPKAVARPKADARPNSAARPNAELAGRGTTGDTPHPVELLIFPRVQLLDVAGPLQVFVTANELAIAAGRPAAYAPRVVAMTGGVSVISSAGLPLTAAPLPAPRRALDTLVVAGGHGVHQAATDPRLLRWVAQRARSARRTASVCTGAFLLAAAGLLDGRRVTTHWRQCAELARRYPALTVESDPIFVRDGDLWTSAGVTAGIDLALAFVEADLGRVAALDVARQLVVFARRPGGQAQFSATLGLSVAAEFDTLHAWMTRNLQHDLTVPALAARAGMSERSFARRYLAATGSTPSRAVERLRVEAARTALGSTRRSIKDVARRCGFGSEETMRRSFLRVLAVAPRDYRARFPAL